MKKQIVFCGVFLAVFCFSSASFEAEQQNEEAKLLCSCCENETELAIIFGGGVNPEFSYGGTFLGLKLKNPSVSAFAFEAGLFNLLGLLVDFPLNVVHTQNFNIYLLPGFFWMMTGNDYPKVSVPKVPREMDFILGLGAEYRLSQDFSITCDWRAFLPNPFVVPTRYSFFAIQLYKDAFSEGQIWLSILKYF